MGEFLYYFLNQVREDYDYIIIDTQPTRDSLLLTNAINAADYVLIPSLCEANSQESAFRTYALCNELRNTPGSHLKGVGRNSYDGSEKGSYYKNYPRPVQTGFRGFSL